MKKVVYLSILMFLIGCGSAYHFPATIADNAIEENYQVIYSPEAKIWANGGMAEDRIVFTKKISSGSGSYSEYISAKQTIYPGTTYEFLFEGRLIGYNQHNLKFYEIEYKDGKFNVIILRAEQVQKIFPKLNILQTSEAINGVLTIKKLPFEEKSFLLLNDTDASYYHYSFEDFTNLNPTPIKSIITVDRARDIIFSHFGSRDALNPILTIKVENGL